MEFEYNVLILDYNNAPNTIKQEQTLNFCGKEGWELVSVANQNGCMVAFMKKIKKEKK